MNCKTGKKVVLMYHRVDDTLQDYNRITVNEKNFRAQMNFLKENYKVLSIDELLEYEGTEDVVTITFDDGFADFYTKALPILEEFQIPATIFVTTGKLNSEEELWTSEIIRLLYGNDSGCDELCIDVLGRKVCLPISTLEQRTKTYRCIRQIVMQLSGDDIDKVLRSLRRQLEMEATGRKEYRFLSMKQCRELAGHPLVTIGAHTVNHVALGKVEEAVMEYEVKTSVKQLEEILGKKEEYFAYPFGGNGDYSQNVINLLKECGIKAAFTTHNGDYQDTFYSKYEIPRVYIGNWDVERFGRCLKKYIKLENLSLNENVDRADFYMGSLDDDDALWKCKESIIIWGTGMRGRNIKKCLTNAGAEGRILAFADNNPDLWNSEVEGIKVWSPQMVAMHNDVEVIVHNTMGGKIMKQLMDMGMKNLHWIV